MRLTRKAIVFWMIAILIAVLDFVSKQIAEHSLQRGETVEVLGNFLRFTLGYNTGIAFGLSLGTQSRWVLILVTLVTMGLILWLFRSVHERHKAQVIAFGLIMGGAIGNLMDRLFGAYGVIDFIDVGIGDARFWTFNIADSAITIGAVLLILASLFERSGEHRAQQPGATPSAR